MVCGLHLFAREGMDDERIQDFKDDIAYLQSQGVLVKLAYGGEEWGNINLYIDVSVYFNI